MGPAATFPSPCLPLPKNAREPPPEPGVDVKAGAVPEAPEVQGQAGPWVGRADSWPSEFRRSRTGRGGPRGSQRPLHLLSLCTCCFADSLHPGAAADPDRGQAEAVPGEPAANHAESNTLIRGAGIKNSVDWGGRAGRVWYCGTQVNKQRGFSSSGMAPMPSLGAVPFCLPCVLHPDVLRLAQEAPLARPTHAKRTTSGLI